MTCRCSGWDLARVGCVCGLAQAEIQGTSTQRYEEEGYPPQEWVELKDITHLGYLGKGVLLRHNLCPPSLNYCTYWEVEEVDLLGAITLRSLKYKESLVIWNVPELFAGNWSMDKSFTN